MNPIVSKPCFYSEFVCKRYCTIKTRYNNLKERVTQIVSNWLIAIKGSSAKARQFENKSKMINLPKNIEVETERFKLTPLRAKDVDDVFLTMNYPNTANIISFLQWPMTKEQAEYLCALSVKKLSKKNGFIFLARNKEDSFPVGCIGLNLDEKDSKTVEVGYWVTECWQRKGCATELLKGIVDFAFKPPCRLERMIATAALENFKSIKVLEKQGFKIIGSKRLPTVKGTTLDCHLFELKSQK